MSNVENFENLKKRIDELKVKNLTNLKEKERLEGELCKIKEKIKEVYGVEIEDFNSAITELKDIILAATAKPEPPAPTKPIF